MFPLSPLWIAFAVSLTGSLLLTPVARSLARRCNVVDRPDGRRKLHKAPVVPLLGWRGRLRAALPSAGALGREAAWWDRARCWSNYRRPPSIAAAGFVCLLGCASTIAGILNPRFKLALTRHLLGAADRGVGLLHVDRIVAFGVPIQLGWFGIPLTTLWLVGCINALNLLDGMDGLASVVGLSTAVMMAILATHTGHHHVAIMALVLAGALAGFLIYNLPPACIYLGDSGAMLIGLVVGILSIQAALKTSATLSITAPAVALSVPMLDSVLAIVRRKLTGRRFDVGDRGHIHHRLLDRGLSNWQALCIIGALCLTTGGAATAATLLSNDALGWLIMLAIVVLLVWTRAFGHHELSLVKLSVAAMLGHVVHRLIDSTRGTPAGSQPSWPAVSTTPGRHCTKSSRPGMVASSK